MERQCQDVDRMKEIIANPSGKHSEKELLLYHKLRQEFLLHRSVQPPFAPTKYQLPDDFDFASYLYINLGRSCAEVVEVKASTWGFFAVCMVIVYLITLAFLNVDYILPWIWLGYGWAFMVVAIAFSYYLDKAKRGFVPANMPASSNTISGINLNLEEEIHSVSPTCDAAFGDGSPDELAEQAPAGEKSQADLPRWCHVDLDKYMTRRGCITKMVCPHKPTRPDTLLWFEKEGHEFHVQAFQIGLIGVDIHLATALITFSSSLPDNFAAFLFLLLAVAPFMVIIGNSRRQMKDVTIVGCTGSFRNQAAVGQVLREAKTAQAVRSFLVLERMHRHAKEGSHVTTVPVDQKAIKLSPAMKDATVEVLARTFDSFDVEGKGAIRHDEMGALLQRFGASMVAALDPNNDGDITKEEFMQWHLERMMYEEEATLKIRARNLFEMFDSDHNGEIDLAEFHAALSAFNMGFTIDEIGMIVTEMNGEGGMSLTLEHFEELVERFYPEELESSNPASKKANEWEATMWV